MSASLAISLDAMGGDNAPEMVIRGADIARQRFPSAHFLFFGDEQRLKPMIERLPGLSAVSAIRHAETEVKMEDKPSQALRAGRKSSMRLAIDAVHDGEAAAIVSAGNTGALMAMAKFVLQTLPGIDRPAIASFFPTMRAESVMLDLGANVECDATNLVQFAVMGSVFARTVLGVREPTIGLLNVGTEELKGHEEVRGAAQILRAATHLPGTFHGFIEGDDIARGHGGRGRHRRLHRQRRAEEHRGHRQALRRFPAPQLQELAGWRASATCWRGRRSTLCARGSIRAATTARSSSASTASA